MQSHQWIRAGNRWINLANVVFFEVFDERVFVRFLGESNHLWLNGYEADEFVEAVRKIGCTE